MRVVMVVIVELEVACSNTRYESAMLHHATVAFSACHGFEKVMNFVY